MTTQINLIRKAISMEIIKPQISITLTKGELNQLLAEALADSESSAAIKKVLNPLLVDKFPQFPEFTVISIGDTDESGSTQVILKQPSVAVAKAPKTPVSTPIKSIEPVVIDEKPTNESATEPTTTPVVDDGNIFGSAPAYVDPNA